MKSKNSEEYSIFSKAATYQIRVAGDVKLDWADNIRDLQIIKEEDPDFGSVSVLTGQVEDQVALLGILNTLCDYHLVLLNLRILL
ncbi:MAG: hypothetical protein WBN20_00980 [Eudoraea sp.]|uniref:hypothetical protein n=1 Tax=Eudoraea sp. TaxID=1979955 RepID=UPI003C73AF25